MKVLYFFPSEESVYAARFIYEGYKNAFEDIGHEFRTCTSNDNLGSFLNAFEPDIFMYGLNAYYLKFIDLQILKQHRDKGLIVFCQIGAWNRSWSNTVDRMSGALKDRTEHVSLIKNGLAGDIFWHWFEQDEPLMDGFTEETGYAFSTIHLAADKTKYYPEFDENMECDVCYVGSYLPMKRAFLDLHIAPLKKKLDVKVFGSDWTLSDRILGYVQKVGQYFNINPLKKVRSLKLSLDDERRLYTSATICLNVHEEQVRVRNCEMNERTFKIIACGGFQISDNMRLIRRFFDEDELVIAEDTEDWFKKIEYFIQNPDARLPYIEAGKRKVLEHHTYHNRVTQICDLSDGFHKNKKQNI